MIPEAIRARRILHSEGYTCVILKDTRVYYSKERGVKPLVAFLESGEDLRGAYAADKVVGRATAFLYALLGIRALHADVISRPALEILKKYNICASYETPVDNISNRAGDGICPFEAAVLYIKNKDEAYRAIREKMAEMHI